MKRRKEASSSPHHHRFCLFSLDAKLRNRKGNATVSVPIVLVLIQFQPPLSNMNSSFSFFFAVKFSHYTNTFFNHFITTKLVIDKFD